MKNPVRISDLKIKVNDISLDSQSFSEFMGEN